MSKRSILVYEKTLDRDREAVVCQLKGKLVGGDETCEFVEAVRTELDEGHCNVVLELSGLSLVNSAGVGVLATLYTSTLNRKGRLVLVGVDDTLRRVLEVVQIWPVIHKADSIEAALAML